MEDFAEYGGAVAWMQAWAERTRVPVVLVLGDPLFTVMRAGYTADAARAALARAQAVVPDEQGGSADGGCDS
jgi:hypothetical protein